MNQRYQTKLKVLQQRRHVSQGVQVEDRCQDSDQDNVPDLHDPTHELAHHANGIAFVSLGDHGGIQDADGYRVVMLGDVVEVDPVA